MALEKIEVGKKYLDSIGIKVEITAIGKSKALASYDDPSVPEEQVVSICWVLKNWSELPKPKKRYWLWDAKDDSGKIFKTSSYVDDNGCTSNGELYFDKEKLIKKHENEFIEIGIK